MSNGWDRTEEPIIIGNGSFYIAWERCNPLESVDDGFRLRKTKPTPVYSVCLQGAEIIPGEETELNMYVDFGAPPGANQHTLHVYTDHHGRHLSFEVDNRTLPMLDKSTGLVRLSRNNERYEGVGFNWGVGDVRVKLGRFRVNARGADPIVIAFAPPFYGEEELRGQLFHPEAASS